MDNRRLILLAIPLLLAAAFLSVGASTSFAVTSSSSNYQVTESEFGATSNKESCSGQYCARASIGDLAAGRSKSPAKTAEFGPLTDSEPLLEVIIEPGVSDLGVLTTEKTASKTMIVRIRNYLSDGYMLQIVGDTPKYGGHKLKALTSPAAATPGTEQFGINAVANTQPAVGAAAVQVPSDQTSFGVVTPNYATPNMFKYASGDMVAKSVSESGRTDYTISMIMNISNKTPAGNFAGDFAAVVIPVF